MTMTTAAHEPLDTPLAAEGAGDHLAGLGAVAELEARLRRHYGLKHALAVSSATSGLHAVALALGLDSMEFITTPYTYGASLAGWLLQRNVPAFADIDARTLTLEPAAVARAIGPQTRAILAVDIFGVPCDDGRLRAMADERGIWYVADASQSLGATRDGRPASALAHVLVTSFSHGKPLDAGEGGAILTGSDDVYEKLLWFSQHPHRQLRELGLSTWNEFALNGRMHPAAAAVAVDRFDAALLRMAVRQERCLQITDVLNRTGMTEPIAFKEARLRPSFFRLTASWQRASHPHELVGCLQAAGMRRASPGRP